VYGYCHEGKTRAILLPDAQRERIEAKGQAIEGAHWVHCRSDPVRFTMKSYWNNPIIRPEFAKLMRELQAGDHLVIWRLDRLDEGLHRMIDCLHWLVNRQVTIHVLEHAGLQLDLNPSAGEMLVGILTGVAEFVSSNLEQQMKATREYRIARGLTATRAPQMGKTWKTRSYRKKKAILRTWRKTHNKKKRVELWDEHQCSLIREIKHRFDHGETMNDVIRDFARRDEKKWNGQPWAERLPKRYDAATSIGRLWHGDFYACYWRYTTMLAEGRDLQDREVSKEVQELAKRQLAGKRTLATYLGNFNQSMKQSLDGVIPERPGPTTVPFVRRDP